MATLYLSGGDEASAAAVAVSIPRTLNALTWGTTAAIAYKRCETAYPDTNSEEYLQAAAQLHEKYSRSLLALCQANGGVYIKAAQFIAAIQSVPVQYRRSLEVLQDRVTPRPFEEVDRVLRRELGGSADELYAEFSHTAAAAASLAQVHKARTHSGLDVAVKIQYLGLEAAVNADLNTLAVLSRAAAWLFPQSFNLGWVWAELRKNLARELDFELEAENAQRLAHCVSQRSGVAVPEVLHQLTNPRVLTMEWIDGCKLTDQDCLRRLHIRPRDVGLLLLDAFADMTFALGFVHADPHPGNIIVRPSKRQGFWLWRWLRGGTLEPELVLLDHGLYVTLPDELRLAYCQLWCAFVINDQKTAVEVATRIAGERGGQILPIVLRPGGLNSVSPEERARLKSQAGVGSLAGVSELLEGLPRSLVEFLRISAIIRNTAAVLGAGIHDRLRINATYALRGLRITRDASGKVTYIGDLASRTRRVHISVNIWAMRTAYWCWSWCRSALDKLTGRVSDDPGVKQLAAK
ncbi:hypothetical protein WJX72_002441 [[Myrmecia] bisecta]|uniref:ABC1 atypical kinase-like domain-containing protein n=1 Tax=[Myrmecia] bisecta TaxID=41462 RepID=A0AAW1PZM7_9CHLO